MIYKELVLLYTPQSEYDETPPIAYREKRPTYTWPGIKMYRVHPMKVFPHYFYKA